MVTITVFYILYYFTSVDASSSAVDHSTVMKVPLDGSSQEVAVPTPLQLGSVSASDDGTVIAGGCASANASGAAQICIIRPGSSTAVRIPGSEDSTMSDVAVSPDGKWIAYASVTPNPYGVEEIYIYNVASGQFTMLSHLPDLNHEPAWPPQSQRPCLAFAHSEGNNGSSIYLGCLTPAP